MKHIHRNSNAHIPSLFWSSYSADATAFVITYPVDNSIPNRKAALAWEAAFLKLAKGRLSDMAAAANLSLSYSAERSVQDELSREVRCVCVCLTVDYVSLTIDHVF